MFDPVGRAVDDVETAAVGSVSREALGEMRIRVRHAAVVLFLERVLRRAWSGVAWLPELLHKLVTLLIRNELSEVDALLVSDDVADVLVEPFRHCG